MAKSILGFWWEGMTQDEVGHREYPLVYLIRTTDTDDGPASILLTPGLPLYGTMWAVGNDLDIWAWCRLTASVKPVVEREKCNYWLVRATFSTKPIGRGEPGSGVGDQPRSDPLTEPMRVSGTFLKYVEEATHDLHGRPIMTSSWEQIRGQAVEFDRNRPSVTIEQNVPDLQLGLLCNMMDSVNDLPLWGLPARCIKLSDAPWERKHIGQMGYYYTRRLQFDINFETFDKTAADEGTKALWGNWNAAHKWILENIDGSTPDPRNPTHFRRLTDVQGNQMRVLLDGEGKPWDPDNFEPSFTDRGYARYRFKAPPTVNTAGLAAPTGLAGTGTIDNRGTLAAVHYEYVVTAVNNSGESLPSTPLTFDNRVVRWHSVSLTWNNVVGALGYRIYRLRVGHDGFGDVYSLVASVGRTDEGPGRIMIAKYPETNFLALGIPLVF